MRSMLSRDASSGLAIKSAIRSRTNGKGAEPLGVRQVDAVTKTRKLWHQMLALVRPCGRT